MAEQEEKKKEAKTKRPSALKRDIQSKKNQLRNRSFRSSVNTAVRIYREAAAKKEAPEALKQKLSTIYSLMDKGVKKGIVKRNKADRTKSRLAAIAL